MEEGHNSCVTACNILLSVLNS